MKFLIALSIALIGLTNTAQAQEKPERVMKWHEAGSLEAMIEANAWVLEALTLALDENTYKFGPY